MEKPGRYLLFTPVIINNKRDQYFMPPDVTQGTTYTTYLRDVLAQNV